VQVAFFVQFGYPGETWQDVAKTFQIVRDCRPDDIGVSVSYPLPGTRFYERVKQQMGDKQNWSDSSDLAMLYVGAGEGPYTTPFYRQVHRVIHKEFRLRKYWAELRQTRSHANRLNRKRLRHGLAAAYYAATLPWDRLRLSQLEKRTRTGLGPLPPGLAPSLSQEACAKPSPQSDAPAGA